MSLSASILRELGQKNYHPLKPKQLAKKLGIVGDDYAGFRKTVRTLLDEGRVIRGGNSTLKLAEQVGDAVGIYRRVKSGHGYVRPHAADGVPQPDIFIRAGREKDAATGDEVVVRLTRHASKMHDAAGEVVSIVQRATRTFVGTYFEREGLAYVAIDGAIFAHSILVGDPGRKGPSRRIKSSSR